MRALYLLPADHLGGAELQGVLAVAQLPAAGVDVVPVVGPGQAILRALERQGVGRYYHCAQIPTEPRSATSSAGRLFQGLGQIVRWRKACAEVMRVAVRHRVDLIFASRVIGWTIAGATARRLGLPAVWRAGSRATASTHKLALRLLPPAQRPALLVCNSRAVRDSIAPALGVPTVVVPNSVDLQRFDPRRVEPRLRAALGLGDSPVVGVAARPCPDKGFDLLADVAQELAARRPGVTFLVAGDYAWRAHYEALFAQRGLAKTVRFLGQIDAVERFFASCDVVLLTSRRRSIEGLSNALLEAMAMERPVVATRVGGVAEAVGHGVEGFLSPPGDRRALADYLDRLLADGPLRRRMGAAGRTRVRRSFSAAAAHTRLAEHLQRLTA